MCNLCGAISVALLLTGTAATAQHSFPVYGNVAGCDVHFNRNAYEATDMVLLKEGQLMFYEMACKDLVVGNKSGQIETLTAQCIGYEETLKLTWNFTSDGNDGFVFSPLDQSYSTVLTECR